MRNLLRKIRRAYRIARMGRNIPDEIYASLDRIGQRYSRLSLEGTSDEEKTSRLIEIINNDQDFRKVVSFSGFSSFYKSPNGEDLPRGWGTTLCLGKEGMFVYHWDDYKPVRENIPATSQVVKDKLGFGAERLREIMVNYAIKEYYVELVANSPSRRLGLGRRA